MSWIDHHVLVVGLAVFGLAYLNSRVTFPTPNNRIAGPTDRRFRFVATAIRSDRRCAHDFAVVPETPRTSLAQELETWLPICPWPSPPSYWHLPS